MSWPIITKRVRDSRRTALFTVSERIAFAMFPPIFWTERAATTWFMKWFFARAHTFTLRWNVKQRVADRNLLSIYLQITYILFDTTSMQCTRAHTHISLFFLFRWLKTNNMALVEHPLFAFQCTRCVCEWVWVCGSGVKNITTGALLRAYRSRWPPAVTSCTAHTSSHQHHRH